MKIVKDNLPAIEAALRSLTKDRVLVGVPEDKAERETELKNSPITNASLAYLHDNGAPELNIPARPFMREGIEDGRDAIANQMKKGIMVALDGDLNSVYHALESAGVVAVRYIKRKITTGPFAPLSPRTLAARRARKISRTNPLIDTGEMRRSINYVIRRKE